MTAAGHPQPRWLHPRSAYVHVPFCAHKCGYCDFASIANAEDRIDDYLTALEREMSRILGKPQSVETIFIGGGTPTHLSAVQLAKLLGAIRHWLPLECGGEFTVEANPNTLDETKATVLSEHGVNRVSLGAQSFNPTMLRVLERTHDPANVNRAVELLRRAGIENLSLDLIFGVPTQTLDAWRSDLKRMTALAPQHCSAYGLTYEKGTKLWRERKLGVVQSCDEELERSMLLEAVEFLGAAGFDHYEISNYARRGESDRRCQHNLTYWRNHAYWGFGNGAASYVNGVRRLNTRELNAYIIRSMQGVSAATQEERLEDEDRARETVIVNLRLLDGIDKDAFRVQTGFILDDLAGKAIRKFTGLGLLNDDGVRLRLTREGLPIADGILAAFL
jgi:oxygen-independent coproporphyrinogen-3 oxidase